MAELFRPPQPLSNKQFKPALRMIPRKFTVFLAGTIEMGNSANWQEEVFEKLHPYDMNILNPRRVVFDDQSIEEQILWELEAMEMADSIIMNFEPDSKSPITLLEFGLHARNKKLVVHCPDGFWRRTNILLTAREYGVKMVNSLDELITNTIMDYKIFNIKK
jgi:hypothetical protein